MLQLLFPPPPLLTSFFFSLFSLSFLQIEIQSDHGKAILYDTMPTQGLPSLPPGSSHEFIVKHDIKDLGPHTLLCASSYVTPAFPNEPKYYPQAFTFQTLNPLIVRTKHRALGSSTVFLEATIENRTTDPMVLESVELVVAAGYSSQNIPLASSTSNDSNSNVDTMDPLGENIRSNGDLTAQVLDPGGGAAGYIFKLTRLWQQPQQTGTTPGTNRYSHPTGSSPRSNDHTDGAALGKLDIKWKGVLGDPARLQTQTISATPRPHRELRLEVTKLPERVVVSEPFDIEISVISGVDRRLGPLKVSYHPASAVQMSLSGPIGGSTSTIRSTLGNTTSVRGGLEAVSAVSDEEGIVLDGLQSECIDEVAPRGRATVTLSMLPRFAGRQYIQGLILTDERDGRVFDTLAPIEVCVEE
jgi:hypothetical protein